jgi:alpha-beta hydrolase superfamily lysophospholipase
MRCPTAICCLLTAALIGCGEQSDAQRFLRPDSSQGQSAEFLLPGARKLKQQKRISGQRVFRMLDGTRIDTWWCRAEREAKGTVLILHGLGEGKAMYLRVADELVSLGYDVVLPDLRGHGSSGEDVTYGVRELGDVRFIMNKLLGQEQVSPPVYVAGVDVGALVALRYAAVSPKVQGVFAVDPMRSLESYVNRQMALTGLERRRRTLDEIGRIGRFDVSEASAIRAVQKVQVPVLIAQGLMDLAVSGSDVEAVYAAANTPKELIKVNEMSVALRWPQWMAEQIDRLATTQLRSGS